MAIDLSALGTATSTAQGLSNLILVNPQKNVGITPQFDSLQDGEVNLEEIDSFLFHYEGENTISLESDITDHFTEDNRAIQDQIAIKPVTITTSGYIGELKDFIEDLPEVVKLAQEKLSALTPFVPVVSATAASAANTAQRTYNAAKQVAAAASSAWTKVTGGDEAPVQTAQQKAYARFFSYQQNRVLCKVQTPWAVFENMAIKSLRAVQDEETRMISNFEITFKQMRFAKTQTTVAALKSTGRAQAQRYPKVNHGQGKLIASTSLKAKVGT